MLGAVVIARAEHCRICNSTCPECAFPIMLLEQPTGEYLVGERRERIFILEVAKIPYAQSWGIVHNPLCTILSAHEEVTLLQKSQTQVYILVSLIKALLLSSMYKTTASSLPPAFKCTSQVLN